MPPKTTTKLRDLRIRHGLTAAKLAAAAGVSPRTLHGIEMNRKRGRDTTRNGLVRALAQLSGESYETEDFFDEEGNPILMPNGHST
ncbi:MAG: helix-turn-helix domain-containing protein [Dehalococcoidia bacterium]|nr:helix-turn-helix domain-containing protein [Dehalococcoidia bacterium]